MGFTAQTFLFIFLPLSIVAYLLCTRLHRPLLNNILLALMSLVFYVFCGLHALVVFLGLIVFVYLMGVLIGYARQAAGEKASRRWMALGAAALVVLLSIVSLTMIIVAGAKSKNCRSYGVCAAVALAMMLVGAMGMKIVPAEYFGVVERFSVFAATGFNAALGIHLFCMKSQSNF